MKKKNLNKWDGKGSKNTEHNKIIIENDKITRKLKETKRPRKYHVIWYKKFEQENIKNIVGQKKLDQDIGARQLNRKYCTE